MNPSCLSAFVDATDATGSKENPQPIPSTGVKFKIVTWDV